MAAVSKSVKITFWISTILVAIFVIPSAFMVNAPTTHEMFSTLGVNADWFRWELEVAKTIAGVLLVIPMIKWRLKEWVYAGLAIDFVSAFIAITAVQGIAMGAPILLFIVVLAVSYLSYQKVSKQNLPLI